MVDLNARNGKVLSQILWIMWSRSPDSPEIWILDQYFQGIEDSKRSMCPTIMANEGTK